MNKNVITGIVATLFVLLIIGLTMWIVPKYSVWQRGLRGEAELRQAEWNKQIIVREAEARLEAEKLNAQAEVERAKGMAQAMEIEGGQLSETYIKYLWVRQLAEHDNLIYIPTEAGLPLLEAGKR